MSGDMFGTGPAKPFTADDFERYMAKMMMPQEPQPLLVPASARPAMEKTGILRQEGDRFYFGLEWIAFEEFHP